MNHGDGPSSVPSTPDAERDRQRYPHGMGSLDAAQCRRPNDEPTRLKPTWGQGLLVLILGLVIVATGTETFAGEHTQPPIRSTGENSIKNPARKTDAQAPLDYCTVGRCRPRAPHPWRDALAFGGFTVIAGSITRRARRRKS